jgi:hypothetical protein
MRWAHWLSTAVILAAIALSLHAEGPRTKPVLEQETLHAIPDSFAEMWSLADLVAKVRLTSSTVEATPSGRIRTEHHAEVLRVFKGTAAIGDAVAFLQVAGQLETADAIIRVSDEEPLVPGTYIVFLRNAPLENRLCLIGDVDGAYKLVKGFLEPEGKFTSFARQYCGLSEERFVSEIEAVAARARRRK